jgi:hypothetical protein
MRRRALSWRTAATPWPLIGCGQISARRIEQEILKISKRLFEQIDMYLPALGRAARSYGGAKPKRPLAYSIEQQLRPYLAFAARQIG